MLKFAGLTIYEAGGGGPLPKNGPEWHEIRDGKIKDLLQCSKDFNNLIRVNNFRMMVFM